MLHIYKNESFFFCLFLIDANPPARNWKVLKKGKKKKIPNLFFFFFLPLKHLTTKSTNMYN